jgi:hypothetical protein
MVKAPAARPKRPAPWVGRRKVADPKSKPFPIRFTPQQFEQLSETARAAGLSVGAFARTVLLGSPGPRAVRRPPIERAELARLLGGLGNLRSNANQIAKAYNQRGEVPEAQDIEEMKRDLSVMRDAVMKALGREP